MPSAAPLLRVAELKPQSPAAGIRGVIDSLVQGSFVELFQAYGVAVAPLPRISLGRAPTLSDVTVVVPFTCQGGQAQQGRLTLSMPDAVLELTKGNSAGTSLKSDWARELGSQLMGRIKNRLLHFDARLRLSSPASVDTNALENQVQESSSLRVYAGRTLRGTVVVTVEGLPSEAQLNYVGKIGMGLEGDTLLF